MLLFHETAGESPITMLISSLSHYFVSVKSCRYLFFVPANSEMVMDQDEGSRGVHFFIYHFVNLSVTSFVRYES